ncbi:hypothetical protein K490DRAFT_16374, partial [Saccharata proteae CBS 121410]
MGQHPTHPSSDPDTTIRVIGAGLPRTGTLSLTHALAHLLEGPVYHGGTQLTLGPTSRILTWTAILSDLPSPRNPPLLAAIATETAGYAAITDTPGAQLVPELLALYPSAIVICTVRDPDAWVRSMAALDSLSRERWWVRWVLWPVPVLRHFSRYNDVLLGGRWGDIYCDGEKEGEPYGRHVWDRHIEWLKEVVPEEKLFFFDVRDGWGPLCGVLGIEVPDGIVFPRENDGKKVEEFVGRMVWRGVWRWVGILGLVGGMAWGIW